MRKTLQFAATIAAIGLTAPLSAVAEEFPHTAIGSACMTDNGNYECSEITFTFYQDRTFDSVMTTTNEVFEASGQWRFDPNTLLMTIRAADAFVIQADIVGDCMDGRGYWERPGEGRTAVDLDICDASVNP